MGGQDDVFLNFLYGEILVHLDRLGFIGLCQDVLDEKQCEKGTATTFHFIYHFSTPVFSFFRPQRFDNPRIHPIIVKINGKEDIFPIKNDELIMNKQSAIESNEHIFCIQYPGSGIQHHSIRCQDLSI